MPVLIHLGGGVEGSQGVVEEEEGWKVRRRPAWSYCSDQGKEKEAWAEMKLASLPELGGVLGAG